MADSSLPELEDVIAKPQRTGPLHGCPVCGEKTTVQVHVMFGVIDKERRSPRTRGMTSSRSQNMCAEHGEELFKKLVEQVPRKQ